MPTVLVPLLLALAAPASQPVVVSAPASAAAPLTTRCAPLGKATNDIECVVQQDRPSAAPATVMRVTVTTTDAAPCRALEAQAVAVPAVATARTAPAGALPVVVQAAPGATCAR